MINFKITKGKNDFQDIEFIRQTVFIDEQKFIDEFDDTDNTAYHIAGYENNKPIVCARFFCDGNNEYHIGRIAVLKEFRGRGLGSEIVEFCESEIKKLGGKSVSLSAQVRASDFYKKMNYNTTGEIYMDEHVEHIRMTKEL